MIYWILYGITWAIVNTVGGIGCHFLLSIPCYSCLNLYLAPGYLLFGLFKAMYIAYQLPH